MAFSIAFHKVSDAYNVMNKTIPDATATSTCTPWEAVSDLQGRVVLDYVPGIEGCNYAVVTGVGEPATGEGRPRSCFITDISKDIGGHMTVTLEVDPLETYKTEIRAMPIVATRCSVVGKDGGNVGYNAFIDDGLWVCDNTTLYWLSPDLMGGQFNTVASITVWTAG